MTARKWRRWWWWREGYFYISPNLSEAETTVLNRTIQESSYDGPDDVGRAVHAGINC
jgi:hypothetical protein